MPEGAKVLVVGAAGRFAGLLIPAFAKYWIRPIGLVRKPEQADTARRNGASDIVIGDLRERASLDAALKDVDRVFYISPVFQEDEAEMRVGFVEAARRAGVSRIVFSTIIHPSLDLRNHASKQAKRIVRHGRLPADTEEPMCRFIPNCNFFETFRPIALIVRGFRGARMR